MTGPAMRSMLRLSAATSSASDVNGNGAAHTLMLSAASFAMTRAQLDPSAHAPCASTTLKFCVVIQLLPTSTYLLHPACDRLPDLVRRIFLYVMHSGDGRFGLRGQAAGEVEVRAAG